MKKLSVPRQGFLSKHFGGSWMKTHPEISEANLQKHGFDNFMYLQLVSEQGEQRMTVLKC